MPKGLKRFYGKGHLHFLTFSCYRRLALLRTERARNHFVEELAKVRAEYDFRLIGFVVMPNHVHLLISEPSKRTVSTVVQMLKQRVSQKIRIKKNESEEGQLALGAEEKVEEARSFWQPRFYDFNVYSTGKIKEKLNYMHANPVIRGLVKHPKDWLWSGWSFYVKGETGLIGIDGWEY
jgi:putative transposase